MPNKINLVNAFKKDGTRAFLMNLINTNTLKYKTRLGVFNKKYSHYKNANK